MLVAAVVVMLMLIAPGACLLGLISHCVALDSRIDQYPAYLG